MTDPQLPPEVSNRLYDKIQEIAQDLRARGIAPQNGAAEATQNGAAPSNGSSNGAAADPQQLNGNTPTSVADLYDPRSYQPFESQLEHY
ncbi:MAG: hypothetical protein HND51_18820, partial [Chloroflexi bacterium]|nr:hypothetical protein [Chloroflexota bacterium]NOH13698.1 hypothetical protein [Chloroflexota bacterium]